MNKKGQQRPQKLVKLKVRVDKNFDIKSLTFISKISEKMLLTLSQTKYRTFKPKQDQLRLALILFYKVHLGTGAGQGDISIFLRMTQF